MIVLFPRADEQILGAKHSRLSRIRYRQVEKVGTRGRDDYPQASPLACRHYHLWQHYNQS